MISDPSGQLRNNMAPGYDPLDPWNLKGAATYVASTLNKRRIMMVDFAALRANASKKLREETESAGNSPKIKSEYDMAYEVMDMDTNEWESKFLLSITRYLGSANTSRVLSRAQADKLHEMVTKYDLTWHI